MDPADVARVLAKAAAFDQRTVGTADVLVWLDAIGDLNLDDALVAVTRHYRESVDFLRPAHLRRAVAAIQEDRWQLARERDAAERRASGPPQIEPVRTFDRSAEIAEFVASVRGTLPPGDPAKLRGPVWLRRHARGQLRVVAPTEPRDSLQPAVQPPTNVAPEEIPNGPSAA